jgi:hypothetical protein
MRRRVAVALLSAVALVVPSGSEAQKAKPVESFTCFAAAMGQGRSGVVQIVIERWSTDEERDLLKNTLLQKGPDALLGALQSVKPRVGFIRMPNTLGWDLLYARSTKNDDGTRRVFLATDRRVAFGEVRNQTRSLDYDFTLVEIHFDANGKGEGKLSLGVKVDVDPKTQQIELENYGARPVDLVNVKVDKKK